MMGGKTNPVVHLELRTSDLSASCRFLTDLLGWRVENVRVGDGSYLALDLGPRLDGGITEHHPGRDGWLPYVEVHDIDRMTERARAAGATMILPPSEGPVGWRSIVATPAGSDIGLWHPKR